MSKNLSLTFEQFRNGVLPDGDVTTAIGLYTVLDRVSQLFHNNKATLDGRNRWVVQAKGYLLGASVGRDDSVKFAAVHGLAMMMGVGHILFPNPPQPEIVGPPAPLKWEQDLNRVFACIGDRANNNLSFYALEAS